MDLIGIDEILEVQKYLPMQLSQTHDVQPP